MVTLKRFAERIRDDACFIPTFGPEPQVIQAKRALAHEVLETFQRTFPSLGDREVAACFVPGRVEVLGKHTDYAGGHSLLAAVDRGFFCISSTNSSDRVRLVEIDARFGACEIPFSAEVAPTVGHWSNYPATMVRRLAANFKRELGANSGVDVAFASDLPVAGGLSGSSALMIMTFFALAVPNRLMETERFQANIPGKLDLAMYLACVENGQSFRSLAGDAGVGTFGGSEDHTQILNAKPKTLSLFQFCPTRFKRDLAFPEDLRLIIAHSGIQAEKTGAAMAQYNRAARRAQAVVERYNAACGTRHQLLTHLADECDTDVERVLRSVDDKDVGMNLTNRFRQFYAEDRRLIPAAVEALIQRDYGKFGTVVDESHELSRLYLENIIPEIDALQRCARARGAVAASAFGAGFGGSAYAIVSHGNEESFVERWRESYIREFPQHANRSCFFTATISGGANELFVGVEQGLS